MRWPQFQDKLNTVVDKAWELWANVAKVEHPLPRMLHKDNQLHMEEVKVAIMPR